MKLTKTLGIAACMLIGISSCKKDFLEEKRDLNGVNEEVFKDSTLAKAYIDYVYGLFLPPANASAMTWNLSANGTTFTQTTEELAGQTNWNRDWGTSVSYTTASALPYFGSALTSSISNNTWTRIRQINIFLQEIDKYGLPENTIRPLKGQMYFWRAWQYFDLVRLYGGVPIVLTPQDPISASDDLKVPRSTSSQCMDQIKKDFDSAIAMLPGKWTNSEWTRITSGAAAAMKGKALLTWASPQFNRNDDRSRWKDAYDANLFAKTLLEANGFGLYKVGSLANGTAWGNMFTATELNNPEAVISFGFNNVTSDQVQKWNGWEQAARPKEILGGGSLSPTKQMVESFPMKDGKMPGSSTYTYSANKFYKNRDPRFYKTFAYNGALWPYQQNTAYRIWTYKWYTSASAATPTVATERLGANSSGIYISKATATNASNANGNFSTSGIDFMEMRFAEVVLNLAESAIGYDKLTEGLDGIKQIRERAGVENLDGNYGLSGITGRDALFAAVLNERKIEFAYEGKRFWDLRRWLLFNNDYGTCTRLGVQPLNGTRRSGYFIGVKKADGSKYTGTASVDPLYKAQNTGAVLAEREPATLPAGFTNYDQYLDYLYDTYFTVTEKDDLDPTTAGWVFKWYNAYYFFGINQSVMNSSPYLEQTLGWDGLNGAGTFDPLK